MGVTLTDVLLFGKAQSDDVDNATLVIYRRNILRWSALGGYLDIIVKGVSPISLPDAIANSLEYLKAFGGTKQGLPAGYDPVNFIYFLDGAYLLTDIVPTYDGKVEMDFATTTVVASAAILGGRTISYGGLFFFLGSDNKFVVDAFSATSTNRYTSTVTAQNNTRYKFTFNNKVGTLESGGTTLFTNTFTGTEANGKELIINGNNNNGSVTGNTEGIYLYSFKVWDNQGKLVANYVPCAKTNPLTVGLYDLVSDTFINAPTSGTWAAGPAAGASVNPTPDAPIDIVCNNGVLKFGQYGKNLNVGELNNQGYSSTGGISTSATLCGTLWKIKVNPGEKYTVSYGNFPDGISGVYISTWLTDGTWNSRQAASFSGSYTYTVPAGVGEVNFTLYKTGGVTIADNSWIQVEAGETATDYEPAHFGLHTDGTVETIEDTIGNTATAEMLLKVGDYTDVQELISGDITRNVGVMVLDGTETGWTKNPTLNIFLLDIPEKPVGKVSTLCSHYEYSSASQADISDKKYGQSTVNRNLFIRDDRFTTVTQFQQWLADQYTAGTPVIIIYPLATPTTESVAGQALQVQAGDNTIEITQASLTGLELEAKYQAAVSLTIQEVQDANLDPNVQVTIN